MSSVRALRRVRIWLAVFLAGLVLSGLTAFPLRAEMHWLLAMLSSPPLLTFARSTHLLAWIARVSAALDDTGARYPFLAYGTDWLAFAHLVIAAAFLGPWRDPVRNRWVLQWGLFCCVAVVPLAFIAGPLRGIPLGWRCIDAAFGLFGAVPLSACLRNVRDLRSAPPA